MYSAPESVGKPLLRMHRQPQYAPICSSVYMSKVYVQLSTIVTLPFRPIIYTTNVLSLTFAQYSDTEHKGVNPLGDYKINRYVLLALGIIL